MDIKVKEDETAQIIRALPYGVAVELGFGPSGAWLKDNPDNKFALEKLAEIRDPLSPGSGAFVGEGE